LIYGSPAYFLFLHGWKIPFAILTIYGLRISLREKPRGVGLVVALSWLISVAIAVGFLVTYPPIARFGGLSNLDERFAEFLYYPAFYFIAVGVTNLRTRMSKRLFNWVVIPSLALFVIPSIIVGTRDPTFFK
jgi:UDP-N-acetylmuramyl pentapeptide phosphotransferase/UDP-N-acetylglucosamine-1-phosphate transferase